MKKPRLTRDAFETHLRSLVDVTKDVDLTATYRRRAPDTDQTTLVQTLPNLAFAGGRAISNPEIRIIGELGQGGMAIVQLAEQLALGRQVAVKTPKQKRVVKDSELLLHEAYVTGRLEHPNIVPVYMLGSDDAGTPQIVMKRIEGRSWEEMVGDRRVVDDPAMLTEHVEILLKVCSAVRFAHDRQVVHRDIKPENVMIGDFDEVYLLDWGLAVSLDDDDPILPTRSEARGMCGTPTFMAPEMTGDDASEVDERTDVYLLGATLHWLLTGRHRHRGDALMDVMLAVYASNPHDYDDDVPAELGAIANRACAREKDDRYPSVDAFRDALDDYVEHRQSIELGAETQERQQRFVELLDLESRDETEELELHDLFGECRFGFVQALRMWPDNDAARDGLQEVLEGMARHYLREGNPSAAQACLSQLPSARPELAESVAALARSLAAKGEDLERLQEMEAELDLSQGKLSRSRLAIAFALFWTASTWHAAWREETRDVAIEAVRQTHLESGIRNLVIVAALMLLFRRRLFVNQANAKLMWTLGAVFVTEMLVRTWTWHFEVNMVYARAVDDAIFGFGAVMVGVLSDRRLTMLALCFYASSIFGVLLPDLQVWIMGWMNLLFFGGVAWIWRERG